MTTTIKPRIAWVITCKGYIDTNHLGATRKQVIESFIAGETLNWQQWWARGYDAKRVLITVTDQPKKRKRNV